MIQQVITLAIETSCDETACAILADGRTVLSNEVYTQIELHQQFGGVVPEIASRNHLMKIQSVVDQALKKAEMTYQEIDQIAVTVGPGLVGALLVGVSYAKALAYSLNIPLIPVNHIEGHIAANYITHLSLEPPFVCLVVSGGHTHLMHVPDYYTFNILGKTKDDAAGEVYDKVARTLGLGYPGGPIVDQLAQKGNPDAMAFPMPMIEDEGYDFSFSGLKSAVLNHINSCRMKHEKIVVEDICASFQKSVVNVLVHKTWRATEALNSQKIVLAGGVAANSGLREALTRAFPDKKVYYPPISLCTDNAAMIGSSGYYKSLQGHEYYLDLNANPSLAISGTSVKRKT